MKGGKLLAVIADEVSFDIELVFRLKIDHIPLPPFPPSSFFRIPALVSCWGE